MLRKIRIAAALVFWVGITLLFLGIGHDWWGWMAKLQFLPSALRVAGSATLGNIAVLAAIIVVTLLVGRIYCSVVCPMGVLQDGVIWLRRQIGLAVNRRRVKAAKVNKQGGSEWMPKPIIKYFRYVKEHRIVRYGVLVLTVAALVLDLQVAVALIAPYSAYGRVVRGALGLVQGGAAAPLLLIGGITLLVIVLCAWSWGRGYCNTVCPVGTVLSLFSRFSLFKIRIDESKCTKCGRCYRGCKAFCIDGETHTVDYSRCIDCFDCIGRCKEGAIKFTARKKAAEPAPEADAKGVSRRQFVATGVAVVGAAALAKAQDMKLDGGLAPVEPKQVPERSCPIVPPGAKSLKNFSDHCTACQLCVSACPNGVLRPSTDILHLLQPQMGYEKGFCRPECTACSDVCPAGAILPVTRDEKTLVRIGTARVNEDLCLAAKGEAGCGNCERHCPTGALRMVNADGKRKPVVNEEQCIGCGACEYLCPARPISAITIDGLETHISK